MNTERFADYVNQLEQDHDTDLVALQAIRDWILQSEPIQRQRINPFAISAHTELGMGVIVPQMLRGVQQGLFDLNWDVHCPHCDMVSAQYHDLSEMVGLHYCRMCEREFEGDFSERIEVTFSLNKSIEDLNLPPLCPPPPSVNPRFQMSVPHQQTASAQETLAAGIYKYNCPITLSTGTLVVDGEPTGEVQEFHIEQRGEQEFNHQEIQARPGPIRLKLTNEGYPISGLWLAERDLPVLALDELPIRLSGLDIIHYPEFQRLFGSQTLSNREQIKIASVTTMFTDITCSTYMYEKLGDAAAYNAVRDHFEILFEAIEAEGGIVLKTIGDAVMASFSTNDQALRSLTKAQRDFTIYNRARGILEQIHIKVGLHRGPAILVNLNGRLDYFGSAINRAARLQSLSHSGEVTFSEDVYQDEVFQQALADTNHSIMDAEQVYFKGIEGQQTVYRVMIAE